ncbi:hypothetical protein [Stenotrophomonas maltophilia]|uniref:hypothetical protein n=1 Tax=Stenotrophomonas maltophilia TaxID=40324 RepID=UPI0034DB2F9F
MTVNVSKAISLSAIALSTAMMLSGCNAKMIKAYGECSGKQSGGGECKVGMEVIWESDGGGKKSIYNSLISSLSSIPDAATFELDTSGSTIPYPATGSVVLRVKNSSTGVISASQTFAWVRTGTLIRAADPSAVNAWIYSNVGNGDSMSYDLVPFHSSYGDGLQVIAGQAKQEGVTKASYYLEFAGRDCVNHPSPHLCIEM